MCNLTSLTKGQAAIIALMMFGLSSNCNSATLLPETLYRGTRAGVPVVLGSHSSIDTSNCIPKQIPPVTLIVAPNNGIVCAKVEAMKAGRNVADPSNKKCTGQWGFAVRVIYIPKPGFEGADAVIYDVDYGKNQQKKNAFITVSRKAPFSSAAIEDFGLQQQFQELGPIQPCIPPPVS
jgi:hypothetical protein